MKLLKQHREVLLLKLEEKLHQMDIKKSLSNNRDNDEFINFTDIDIFLLEKEIELIKSSLINNEIDF